MGMKKPPYTNILKAGTVAIEVPIGLARRVVLETAVRGGDVFAISSFVV